MGIEGMLFNMVDLQKLEDALHVSDHINHPTHYTQGKIETIDHIDDIITPYTNGNDAFLVGQVIKYLSRAPFKQYKESLFKAQWYMNRLCARQHE